MKLYSHPRSGTNWIRTLLGYAIYGSPKFKPASTGHWSKRYEVMASDRDIFAGHMFYEAGLPGPKVYLYRDGRDVVLSMWRAKNLQHKRDRGLSFSEFLRLPLDWYATPGKMANSGINIVQHWKKHVDSWRKARNTLFISYESMLNNTQDGLEKIAEFAHFRIRRIPEEVNGVGPSPSGDYRTGKWRDVFSKKDLAYFHKIVPKNHWCLYNG